MESIAISMLHVRLTYVIKVLLTYLLTYLAGIKHRVRLKGLRYKQECSR